MKNLIAICKKAPGIPIIVIQILCIILYTITKIDIFRYIIWAGGAACAIFLVIGIVTRARRAKAKNIVE